MTALTYTTTINQRKEKVRVPASIADALVVTKTCSRTVAEVAISIWGYDFTERTQVDGLSNLLDQPPAVWQADVSNQPLTSILPLV